METLLAILSILVLGATPLLWIWFVRKRRNTTARQIITPLAQGSRYRDGATTYNQYRGVRVHIEIEDPREQHNARYQRRHPLKQHKRTKPWERK